MWVVMLLAAWAVVLLPCARLGHAALRADRERTQSPPEGTPRLRLYDTAFLAGGPGRVVDLALVAMAQQRRVLLAHTGWTTVVDPAGRDEVERAVVAALGPDGQARTAEVRAAAAASPAVTALGERLAQAGLALTGAQREGGVSRALRGVRRAAAAVCALGLAAELLAGEGEASPAPYFSAPLLLALGALAVARGEGHRGTPDWATQTGRDHLASVAASADPGDLLTALALRGPRALPEAELRAALAPPRAGAW